MVGRTVAQYIRAGVAGFHIEDQVVNKRCGHLANKQLVSEDVFLSRIRACVNMRRDLGEDIVIIARTDALASLGYDAAISRLKTAVATGADAVLLEAIETVDQAKEVCKTMAPTPVMYGMVQGSSTPHLSVKEAEECGIRILVYAGVALAPVLESVTKAMRRLKTEGTVERNTPKARELFSVCGLNELVAFDQAAGGDLYTKGA
jgi:2-methylisocitrate lyase-like PEP mutase family enzyme